ncbi:YciI family protein [Streptomyces sp. NRRL B-24484]|uniref:YciI family protein n=1 Tax=Streptomyces sp. NRRL B-24484 TaxID=1463833 RepID=UPI001F25FA2F|nr:YciI family protein [Streptomyces sp. NRRL B-24484]
MLIVKANEDSEAGVMPTKEAIDAMNRFNEELIKAGIMLAADGLHPSSNGARLTFQGGKATVTDGPFAETKELIAGFWVLDVSSREEALEWAGRAPFEDGAVLELRKVFEASDFPSEILSPEIAAKEQAWRDEHQKPITG